MFEGLVVSDDGVSQYATYGLSLKEDQAGVIEGVGGCTAAEGGAQIFHEVRLADLVDIGVVTPAIEEEVRPVLMGGF